MPVAPVFFAISLVGLVSMIAARLTSMRTGKPGLFSFLSKYDSSVARLMVFTSIFTRASLALSRQQSVTLFRQTHQYLAEFAHTLIKTVEQRVRTWREFARERKIERGDASAYIQDVVDYKKELKQNGHQPQ